ncbi:MAG: hypothetical protein WC307_01750 [Candidatus Nanoarchaeia archaeon]|jgi:hypothetical protein
MSEEQQVAKAVISQQSVFKIKDFYDFLYDLVKSIGFDTIEDEFRKSPEETVFEWTCLRWVDDYIKFKIWIKVKITDAKGVKVKRGEIAESMSKASVDMTIKGFIVTDWQNRWENKPLIKLLKGFYDKYLFKPIIEDQRKTINSKVYLIENEVKSFFELPRFM